LLAGGWEGHPGKRVFVTIHPEIAPEKAGTTNQVTFRGQWVESPESVLQDFGLGQFSARASTNPLGSTLEAEQMETLVTRLKESSGVKVLSLTNWTVLEGHEAGIGGSESDDEGRISYVGPAVQFVPTIAKDGGGIDLAIEAKFGPAQGGTEGGVWTLKDEP
jgi:hypothetical protein